MRLLRQAHTGTPKNMPATPKKPPPTKMAMMTHKLERPVVFPRILGPMTLPSSCWRARTNITKYSAWRGETSRIRKVLGMAPRKGPKKGITLVTPTKTDTKGV